MKGIPALSKASGGNTAGFFRALRQAKSIKDRVR